MARLTRALATTPGRLRALALVTSLVVAILVLVVVSTTFEHRGAVHQIGVDDAPSVIAAHNIKVEIESLDAALLNEMLVPRGEHGVWTQEFAQDRVDIGRHLLTAIHSAYGDDEDALLEKLEDGLGHYLMVAQETRDAHHRGDDMAALTSYEQTFQILEQELVAPAQQLNKLSDDSLEDSYEAQQHHSSRVRTVITLLGILCGVLIVATQLHLKKTFRRLLSPALLAAFVLAAAFVGCTLRSLGHNETHLRALKEDAYDSVDALLASLADAYEARSAESRALYDQTKAEVHAKRFDEYTSRVAKLDGGTTFEAMTAIVTTRNAAIQQGDAPGDAIASNPLRGMHGSLATALDNIAFTNPASALDDEPTQAIATLQTYAAFVASDTHVQAKELSGHHEDAVKQLLGENGATFHAFDESLMRWLAIDQEWLAHFRDEADEDVKSLELLAPIFGLLIIAAVFGALHPRIKEYG